MFENLRFRKNFFLNLDFGCHRKVYRFGPCIPIFRSFFIKNTKRMCICEGVIFSIDTCEKCFFRFKKGISDFLSQVAPIYIYKIEKNYITGRFELL